MRKRRYNVFARDKLSPRCRTAAALATVALLLALPSRSFGWMELFRESLERGDYPSALSYLDRAEREGGGGDLEELKGRVYLRWGVRLIREGRFPEAGEALRRAERLAPERPEVYRALGELMYLQQRLDRAVAYWEHSLELAPGQENLAGRLEEVRREKEVEERLERSGLANFQILTPPEEESVAGLDRIRDFLLEAASEVGRDFHHYPSRTIVVILYPRREFERLRTTPEGTGGIYDGKIRLPLDAGGIDPGELRRILWHEYTHALVHDLYGNNVPLWLHEGLAQIQEEKVAPLDIGPLLAAARADELISWGELDRNIGGRVSPLRRRLAYLQAYSLTDFLLFRYGWEGMKRALERIREGEGWPVALEDEFLRPLPELEEEWRQSLEL